MKKLEAEDIVFSITDLDDLCLQECISEKSRLYITGGAALLLKEKPIPRPTADIDVLETTNEIEFLLAGTSLNTDVRTFLFQFPHGWKIEPSSFAVATFTTSMSSFFRMRTSSYQS